MAPYPPAFKIPRNMDPCSKADEINRIVKVLDGNGREGLINQVTRLNTKMDYVSQMVESTRATIKWLIGVIILGIVSIGVTIYFSI